MECDQGVFGERMGKTANSEDERERPPNRELTKTLIRFVLTRTIDETARDDSLSEAGLELPGAQSRTRLPVDVCGAPPNKTKDIAALETLSPSHLIILSSCLVVRTRDQIRINIRTRRLISFIFRGLKGASFTVSCSYC